MPSKANSTDAKSSVMQIIDKDNILPDPTVLEDVIENHPFLSDLKMLLKTVTIRQPNQDERVHIQTDGNNITLVICPFKSFDEQQRYILFHEIGHVADRFNPAFKYNETTRYNLSNRQGEIFRELWNLYIDARLSHLGIYRHLPGKFSHVINGNRKHVERTPDTQLLERIDFLNKRGFSNADIVHDIWDHPEEEYSFNALIYIVKQNTIEA